MPITLTQLRSQIQLNQEPDPDWNFWETVKANIGYTSDPLIEMISNQRNFPDVDLEYFPTEDLEGYEEYSSSLLYARNQGHMSSLKRGIDERLERNETMARAPLAANLLASLFDPVNFIALPLGGPMLMGRGFVRGAKVVGGFQAGLEAIRYPFDAVATREESALNIAFASVAGGLITAASSVPRSIRNKAYTNLVKDADEKMNSSLELKFYNSMSEEELKIASSKNARNVFLNKTDEDLKNTLNSNNNQMFGLEQVISNKQWPDGKKATSKALKNAANRIKSFEKTNTKILQERAIRRVTDGDTRITNKLSIAAGGWVSKLISKPTTRILGSEIPDKSK